jgi:hypothetical protein
VNDALVVYRGEAMGNLDRKIDGLLRREVAGAHTLGQRLAFEQLGHDIRPAVVRAEVVHGHDVRMVERTRHPRLLLETRQAHRIAIGGRLQDLDGDVAGQSRVVGAVDLAHASCPDQAEDLVRA